MYHKRTNKKQDGLVLAFSTHKFKIYNKSSKMHVIKLNDLSLGCASISSQQYFKKNQIAIYCILHTHNNPNHLYFVINTHLYWHPEADNIRLRQMNYLLNIINSKCIRIRKKDPCITQISLIFCGDFNTLPNTAPYHFMLHGEFTMKAKGNSSLKLMMDSSLNKVARWMRSVGVDCSYFPEQRLDSTAAAKLFSICRSEQRILVTLSKRLSARKDIPSHLLLSNHLPMDNLKQLIKYFGIEYDNKSMFTRCTLCNGLFKILSDVEEIKSCEQIPESMKINAEKHKFWKCLECEQVYWFGEKSKSEVLKFKRIFDEAAVEIDEESKIKKEKLKKRLMKAQRRRMNVEEEKEYDSDIGDLDEKIALLPNLQRYFWENVTFTHPFGRGIKSSYFAKHGKNPKYTNRTNHFVGCLDYIFYADLVDQEVEGIRCIDSELMEGDGNYYPNSTWPSDHLLLMSTFEIVS